MRRKSARPRRVDREQSRAGVRSNAATSEGNESAMSKMGRCLASLGHVPMRTGIVGLGTDGTAQPSASAWGLGQGVPYIRPLEGRNERHGLVPNEADRVGRGAWGGATAAPIQSVVGTGAWTDPENRPPQRAPPRGDGEAGDSSQRVRPSCLTNPGAPCAPNKRGSTRAVWPRETLFRADAPLLRAFSSQSFYQKMTPARMGKRPPAELSRT